MIFNHVPCSRTKEYNNQKKHISVTLPKIHPLSLACVLDLYDDTHIYTQKNEIINLSLLFISYGNSPLSAAILHYYYY